MNLVDETRRMIKPKVAVLLVATLVLLSNTALAQSIIHTESVPDYDYSQTHHIIFYGDGDYVVLANPFEHPAPVMGALVFEIILMYASQLQLMDAPPSPPTHTIDLLMLDRFGEKRIGQRLYLGDAWLSDGKSIAYLSDEDHQRLMSLLLDRYRGTELSSSEKIAHFRRPRKDELPDSWLPQQESVVEAARKMGLGESAVFEESSTPTEAEQSDPAASSLVSEDSSPLTQERFSRGLPERPRPEDESTTLSFTDASELDGPMRRANEETHGNLPVGTPSQKDERNGWVWILSVLALVSLLVIWVKQRHMRR